MNSGLNNQVKTVLLLGVLSALLIAFGGLLGPNYLTIFVVIAVVMNFAGYFFSDKMVLAMSGAREVSPEEAPRLHAIVTDLAQRAGLPKPRVCVTPGAHANAFATGRNPRTGVVAVTEGILHVLSERELRGVIAHELGHIKNRDILISSVAAMLAGAIASIASAVKWGAIFGGHSRDENEGGMSGAEGLVMALVAPLAATLLQMGISRAREYSADAASAAITGDPEALISALQKLHAGAEHIPGEMAPATASLYIVNPFAGVGGLLNLFSTHPPFEERIARLREMVRNPQRLAV